MFAAVILVTYLLINGTLLQSIVFKNYQNEPRPRTETDPRVADHFGPQNKSLGQIDQISGQSYQNQSRQERYRDYYNFGQRLKNISRPQWTHLTTTSKPPKTTTQYVPETLDYPLAGGEPLSTFTFADSKPKPENSSFDQLVDLTLGTEAPNDVIEDGSTEPVEYNEDPTNLVGFAPNQQPETENKVKVRLLWQVSVFSKQEKPFLRVCGGSMVSRALVISAAHCFWHESEGLLPATMFAVGAGKVLPYHLHDYGSYRQQNDVGSIKVPPTFKGANFQHDIAILQLADPFYHNTGMRPVCVSFHDWLDNQQLPPGNIATTLGAGIPERGKLTPLQTFNLTYVTPEECRRTLDRDILQYFTEDKICAGIAGTSPNLGSEICTRDSGAGLASYLGDKTDLARGIAVPYLRGVASLSHPCDVRKPTLYTNIHSVWDFLKENIKDVEEECGKYYPQLGALLAKDREEFVCDCFC